MSKETMVVNAIRILAAEGVQKAKSGHPGMPMGAAPAAYAIWGKEMKHNPADPHWLNRDRFVLSSGHGVLSSASRNSLKSMPSMILPYSRNSGAVTS